MEDQPKTSKVIDITSRLRSRDAIKADEVLSDWEAPKDFQALLVEELSSRIKTEEDSERLSVLLLLKVYERWPKYITDDELISCREILSDLKKFGCRVYNSMLKLVDFMEATPRPNTTSSLMASFVSSFLRKEVFYDPSKDQELISYLLEPGTRRIELVIHGATIKVLSAYGK